MFSRQMSFGGSWYPADRADCERQILSFQNEPLPAGTGGGDSGGRVSLGVVPHAGWMFSGRLAARVFQTLPRQQEVDLVVVLGGHLRETDPVVAMTEGQWETPFGPFRMHTPFQPLLESLPAVLLEDERQCHDDNSVELQLPFARYHFPRAELLTLRVPPSAVAQRVGELLDEYLRSSALNAVLLGSTDLTHYGPNYHFEPQGQGQQALEWVRRENDPAFISAVESVSEDRILDTARQRHNACSPGAVAALCRVASREGLSFRTLDYSTSHDIMPGDFRNFVGYVGGVFA
ncbi:MAG: AmmeMemoRadiSam system protein B [Deltaproteobacteria bacterium]|nr:AmmeMemoRadiSam system protein B [Deltaproteobacteria bacterium]